MKVKRSKEKSEKKKT